MMRLGRRQAWWLIAFAIFVVVCALSVNGRLRGLENPVADLRAALLKRPVSGEIVIVGVDAASLEALPDWPWPRRRHARLLDHLRDARPARVFLDFDFSEPTNASDDAALDESLARRRDFPVLLPAFVREARGVAGSRLASRPLRRFARSVDLVAIDTRPGVDGRVREWRSPRMFDGERMHSVVDPHRSLAGMSSFPLDLSIDPASFTQVSYTDVIQGRLPAAFFTGKVVLVGATAPALGEMLMIPVHGPVPRVVAHALAAETVIAGLPRPLAAWQSIGWLALWAGLATALFGARRRRNLLTAAMLLAGVAVISLYARAAHNVPLETAAPMLIVVTLLIAATLQWIEMRTWRALAYAAGMRRRNALLKSVVHSSTDCILCIDGNGIIRMANPAASKLFDCPAHQLVDAPIGRFVTLLAGDGVGARLAALHGAIRECDARTARGEVFPVEMAVSRVRPGAATSLRLGERLYTAIVRDIRERRAQTRDLQHAATHDSLTSLPNRAALIAQLDRALAPDRSQPSIALLMLDLCRFKEVNDTLGHNVGDRVLCEVARRFRLALGERGFIARIGGDEFTVVIDKPHSADTIVQVSHALVDSLRAPIDVAGISIEVGVSIGIARFPQDASEAQTLLRHADVAMYVSKRRGTPFEYYDAAYDENSVRKLAIGGELRSAIANGSLDLHYQPQVNLRSGMVDSVEALVRWFHPTQGAIPPAEFIAIAESTDLIRPLTQWTLSGALAQVRAWRDRGVQVRIAVNLSARLLQDTGFPVQLRQLLADSGVPASSLELEITESAMMLDPARALRVIQEIDRLGVLISIDDFGTGYSSLGYLRDLPVHALKLDRSFVAGMRSNGDDRIIVESTAQMAHAMRLELFAEGVESDWDAQFLSAAGFDYAQGYHYCAALPPDMCLAWMIEFNANAMAGVDDSTVSTALHSRALLSKLEERLPPKRGRVI